MGQGAFGVDDGPRPAAARELGAAAVIVGREPCVHVQRDPGIGGAGAVAQDIDEIGRCRRASGLVVRWWRVVGGLVVDHFGQFAHLARQAPDLFAQEFDEARLFGDDRRQLVDRLLLMGQTGFELGDAVGVGGHGAPC